MKSLYTRQEQHVESLISIIRAHGAALDSSETGTGKTITGAEIARRANGNILVVCPKAVIPTWISELKERGVEKFEVVNYEKLRTGKTPFGKWDKRKWVWTLPPSVIIFDEAHRGGGIGTQNSKMIIETKGRYATLMLSATIANSPLQMRAAGWLLGLHMMGNFWGWALKNGCAKNRWNGVDFVGNESHIIAIAEQMAPRCSRMKTSELAEHFTETQIITEPLQFGDGINDIYDEMEKEIAELEVKAKGDSKDSTAQALVAQLRARQKVEILKVPVIVEMAQDLVAEGKSVAIFVNFHATLEALCEKLKTNCCIHGKQTDPVRQKNIEDFQGDKARIIICNTSAGGVAISLHDVTGNHPRASIISPDWNEKNIVQVCGRIHRAGGKTPSMQRLLFAAGTVEERVELSVRKKIKLLRILNENSSCTEDKSL